MLRELIERQIVHKFLQLYLDVSDIQDYNILTIKVVTSG